MSKALRSVAAAFALFSRIPVPARWLGPDCASIALAALPLVGVFQGLVMAAWGHVATLLALPAALMAGVLVALPVLINGGIHFDGLADASDALSSYAPREKKLEILDDPHIGAFGVLAIGVYLVLQFSLFSIIPTTWHAFVALAFSCMLSRSLSGLAMECLPKAKDHGMAVSQSPAGCRRGVVVALVSQGIFAVAAMIVCDGLVGLAAVFVALVVLAWYRHVALSRFGGVTGDLAGWFLQWAELAMLAVLSCGGLL